MKITIAQLDPTVGDIEGNLSLMSTAIEKASKDLSDLIVFSELFLTAYPPRDLLEFSWFIDKVNTGIDRILEISKSYPELGILIGTPTKSEMPHGRGLYNSAILLQNGKIIHKQHKSLLPTYDIFDEVRYFDPASEIEPVKFKGEKLGINICEDAWNDPVFWPGRKLYSVDPIETLVKKGATFLINISASPFNTKKQITRYRIISNQAAKYSLPFLYVNQVGGNDELIFDGRSMLISKIGKILYELPSFSEDVVTIDTDELNNEKDFQQMDDIELVHDALILGIKDYLKKCGFKRAVVGLSGGIDSAVTICLAVQALGKENVLGISMPSPYSSKGSIEDSRRLSDNLGITFKIIPISEIYNNYLNTLLPVFNNLPPDITEENIQARIRGNILMAISNKFGHLVLSTGNKSELAVGYCTLYGDMSGGLAVISDVPKTMVYKLARFINRNREIIPEEIIKKAPSAELRPEQKDEDSLPPYKILDEILQYFIEEGLSIEEIINKGFDKDTVIWVAKAIARNEYKRKQAALGLKVTTKAFGMGRRMPIAAKYI
ncbi:MAG: NAD+ synthase [Spirochaetes bacterium]|nr:MAG: NAD+ synthase [Spirochaetota bacterium]